VPNISRDYLTGLCRLEKGAKVEGLEKLKAAAGLDLGAITPDEIAVSIVAKIVAMRRSKYSRDAAMACETVSLTAGARVLIPASARRLSHHEAQRNSAARPANATAS